MARGPEALRAQKEGGNSENSEEGAVLRALADQVWLLKLLADSVRLTANGVVPLDLTCPSSREALLGPAGTAYTNNGIVVATNGSLKRVGTMGTAMVSKDDRLPLPLHRHPVRQLLVHVIKLINRRAETGRTTRFIKVRAHRGEPLNKLADALASEAPESDQVQSIVLDQDPEAVYFNLNGTWVKWDTRVREDLVQLAAGQYVASIIQPKRGRAGAEASPPALPLTAFWLLRRDQGRSTLGKVLGEVKISTAKKQVLQSIAGAFPCNAVLHKWGKRPSAACALCCHPAETQSHIQCLCPALKEEARIQAHHNMAQRLWKCIKDSTKGGPSLQSRLWRGSRACRNRKSRLTHGSGPGMRWTTCIWKVRRCRPTPTWQLNENGRMPGR